MFSIILVYFLGNSVNFVETNSLQECYHKGAALVAAGSVKGFQCTKVERKNEKVFV